MRLPTIQYSLAMIQGEARALLEQGLINRRQPIYALCRCFPAQDWPYVESELERNEFLLRDRICDLLACEVWAED
ncbi:DUF4327 domain-containing protein [Leptolyngbya sp. 'hensonii']|uniref:DUF4327 family protein n=1 Tax=Leptolyngbya sp. 'hensonii' TaxID=1922337 RepID=UPI0009501195|nr:DUF4327 family protein [Leptolyngbya sp. 'hensonii']OLP20029.1 DUF4327 domain-containing protein [Leptolyngbya sp. 'hensonii']